MKTSVPQENFEVSHPREVAKKTRRVPLASDQKGLKRLIKVFLVSEEVG